MYLLVKNDGTTYSLSKEAHLKIGRQTGDILLDDSSISRRHAEIFVKNQLVYVKDLRSTGGTFVSSVKIQPEQEIKVRPNAVIQFGTRESIFTLRIEQVLVTHSVLDTESKNKFNDIMKGLDFKIMQKWDFKCTHIVVSNFALTRKVLCALIVGQYIVKLEYFEARLKSTLKNLPLPSEDNYKFKEFSHDFQRMHPINYEINRKNLFRSKVFVFADDASLKRMHQPIKLAGGQAVNISSATIKEGHLMGREIEYVLVMDENHSQSFHPEFDAALLKMESLSRRAIPIQEIAYAILLGSTEKDCNSYYNKVGNVLKGGRNKQSQNGSVLVQETQTQLNTSRHADHPTIIPDSCQVDAVFKRKVQQSVPSDLNESELKRRKVENIENLRKIVETNNWSESTAFTPPSEDETGENVQPRPNGKTPLSALLGKKKEQKKPEDNNVFKLLDQQSINQRNDNANIKKSTLRQSNSTSTSKTSSKVVDLCDEQDDVEHVEQNNSLQSNEKRNNVERGSDFISTGSSIAKGGLKSIVSSTQRKETKERQKENNAFANLFKRKLSVKNVCQNEQPSTSKDTNYIQSNLDNSEQEAHDVEANTSLKTKSKKRLIDSDTRGNVRKVSKTDSGANSTTDHNNPFAKLPDKNVSSTRSTRSGGSLLQVQKKLKEDLLKRTQKPVDNATTSKLLQRNFRADKANNSATHARKDWDNINCHVVERKVSDLKEDPMSTFRVVLKNVDFPLRGMDCGDSTQNKAQPSKRYFVCNDPVPKLIPCLWKWKL